MGALENGLFPNWAMVKIINHLKIGGAGFSIFRGTQITTTFFGGDGPMVNPNHKSILLGRNGAKHCLGEPGGPGGPVKARKI